MNKYKQIIYKTIGLFLLSFIIHFLYTILKNPITSIIAPVNESIWEHMKIISTSILLYIPIEKILQKKYNTTLNNYLLSKSISIPISIITYLIIYLPLYNLLGENIIASILLLLIIYIFTSIIEYTIHNKKEYNTNYIIPVTIITTIYIIFTYLTYNPIHNYIFYDTQNKGYGIIKQK